VEFIRQKRKRLGHHPLPPPPPEGNLFNVKVGNDVTGAKPWKKGNVVLSRIRSTLMFFSSSGGRGEFRPEFERLFRQGKQLKGGRRGLG
jgi:hypothetical protein